MKTTRIDSNIESLEFKLIQGENPKFLICIFDGDFLGKIVLEKLDGKQKDMSFLLITSSNRNHDFATANQNAMKHSNGSFTKGADETVKEIKRILAYLEKNNKYEKKILMGYSLGGLISIYSSFFIENFDIFISMSGSFWFNEWDQVLKNNYVQNKNAKFYISMGDKEKSLTKEPLNKIFPMTKLTVENLKCSHDVEFETDEGGHMDHEKRIEKALKYLSSNLKTELA